MILKKNRLRSLSLAMVAAFFLVFVVPRGEALAYSGRHSGYHRHYRPGPPVKSHYRYHRPGPAVIHHHYRHRVPWLPLGVALLTVAGIHYYYHRDRGAYYQKDPTGYVAVRAPIGAVVTSLPSGYTSFYVGPVQYFYFGGVYYRTSSPGYMIVDPPYAASPPAVIDSAAPASASENVSVIAQLLNVRSGPGMEHAVVQQVSKGVLLEVHGTSPGWFYVKTPSGRYGWVMTQFTAASSSG